MASGGYDPIDTGRARSGRRTHQVRQARRRIVLDARLPASTFRAIPCRLAEPAPRLRRGHRPPAGRKRADRVPRSRRLGPRLRVSASDPRLLTASPTDPRRPAPGGPAPLPGTAPERDCAAAVARPCRIAVTPLDAGRCRRNAPKTL